MTMPFVFGIRIELRSLIYAGGIALLALLSSETLSSVVSFIGFFPFIILGGGGTDSGTGAGDDCACATGSPTGCISGSTGTSGTGDCTCAGCSTPFLYVKNEAEFLMDNDVMFGKPSSLFGNLENGIEAYRAGEIKSDVYLVQKPVVVDENGEVKLQIREIEPEVSAIFHASLSRLAKNEGKALYVTSDFSGCVRADSTNKEVKIIVTDSRGVDLSPVLCKSVTDEEKNKAGSVTLETGDYLDLVFNENSVEGRYLIMESWYRDWTLGQVYSKDNTAHFIVSPYKNAANYAKKGALAGATAFILGYLGLSGSFGLRSHEERDALAGSFGLTNVAYADSPHGGSGPGRSLEVSYRDTVTNSRIDVIEPRYARPYSVAIKIPNEALIDGRVHLRITATKRHKVSNLKVVSGVRVEASDYEKMELKSAYHHREKRDYADTLREKNNDYLKTHPSDIITLTFAPESESKESAKTDYHYLLNIGGVYAPASREDQEVVGDWVPRLDSEAKSFISAVYKESFSKELKFKEAES